MKQDEKERGRNEKKKVKQGKRRRRKKDLREEMYETGKGGKKEKSKNKTKK